MGDLSDQVILLTGAGSGIGLEAAVKLARRGAKVLAVARDATKAEVMRADICARAGSGIVEAYACDFSSLKAIRALAAEVRARHERIDVLINNAGLVSDTRRLSADGIELTFAVNHLGYFLLTKLLLDRVEAAGRAGGARIVNVSSIGHYRGDLDFDDLGYERGGYFIMSAYRRSKLANVLFTNELSRRLAGSGVTVNSLHPGGVATNIWSKAPWYARPLLAVVKKLFMITSEEGAETIVYLAASAEVRGKSGGYYQKNKLTPPHPMATDEAVARRLWEVSEAMVAEGRDPPVGAAP